MDIPVCCLCNTDVPKKQKRRQLSGDSKEAKGYVEAINTYLQANSMDLSTAEFCSLVKASPPYYVCSICGNLLNQWWKFRDGLMKTQELLGATTLGQLVQQREVNASDGDTDDTDILPHAKRPRVVQTHNLTSITQVLQL